jgi:hypothetical protein
MYKRGVQITAEMDITTPRKRKPTLSALVILQNLNSSKVFTVSLSTESWL